MSEEIKTEVKECKCLKVFLLNVFASFLGCLIALCIYNAATRPQFPPIPMRCPCPQMMPHHMKGHPDMINPGPHIKIHKHFQGGPAVEKPITESK